MDIKVRANFVEIFLHVVQHVYGEKWIEREPTFMITGFSGLWKATFIEIFLWFREYGLVELKSI
jgi:hypothetical protein